MSKRHSGKPKTGKPNKPKKLKKPKSAKSASVAVPVAAAPASGAALVTGANGPAAIGVASAPNVHLTISIERVLKIVIEGYLLGDLESMATEIEIKEFGAVGYPMVMTVLSGSELLGVLTSGVKQANGIATYFRTYMAQIDQRYGDVAEIAANACRHGIAHNYLSWPGVGVVRGASYRHLGLEGDEVIFDCLKLSEDFRRSYQDHARADILADLKAAQSRFDALTQHDRKKAQRLIAKLPSQRFPKRLIVSGLTTPTTSPTVVQSIQLATPAHVRSSHTSEESG
jgi:hypothetical protein